MYVCLKNFLDQKVLSLFIYCFVNQAQTIQKVYLHERNGAEDVQLNISFSNLYRGNIVADQTRGATTNPMKYTGQYFLMVRAIPFYEEIVWGIEFKKF